MKLAAGRNLRGTKSKYHSGLLSVVFSYCCFRCSCMLYPVNFFGAPTANIPYVHTSCKGMMIRLLLQAFVPHICISQSITFTPMLFSYARVLRFNRQNLRRSQLDRSRHSPSRCGSVTVWVLSRLLMTGQELREYLEE